MADRFDVTTQAQPYGSVGGAGARSLQQEILRRIAMQEALRQEAAQREQVRIQNERVAQQDGLNRRVTLENLASNVDARAAATAGREASTRKTDIEQFTSTHKPGAALSAADKAEADRLKLGGLQMVIPGLPKATAPVNLPGTSLDPQTGQPQMLSDYVPETPTVHEPDTATYLGTEAQQKQETDATRKETQERFVEDVLGGKYDDKLPPEALTAIKAEFAWKAAGATGTLPAGVVMPKHEKTAVESRAQRDAELEEILAKPKETWTPKEAATVAGRRGLLGLQGEQANQRLHVTIDAAGDRQDRGFTNTAIERFKARVASANKELERDIERVDRAQLMLSKPNFVADSVAAPEFLQIVAGGMGTGLRMTDAELRRVQEAQTWLEQQRARLAKLPAANLFGIDQTTIGKEMRARMREILDIVAGARERKAMAEENAMLRIGAAKTPEDVSRIEAEYWKAKREAGRTVDTPGSGSAGPSYEDYQRSRRGGR